MTTLAMNFLFINVCVLLFQEVLLLDFLSSHTYRPSFILLQQENDENI